MNAKREFALPETTTPGPPPVASFADLGLPPELERTLAEQAVQEPFPIQAVTLPAALAGRDVLGRARTGSGKTLAFGLALLARTAGRRAAAKRPLALVLVPTRELAQQVADALDPYAAALGLRLATAVGGLHIGRQATALKAGAEVLIATPGRLADLVGRRDCRLDDVRITVLDEADQMCDLGFLPQVLEILGQVRPDGQRLLFSATLDKNVDRLVHEHLEDPVVAAVDAAAGAVTTMEHHVLHVHGADKQRTATEIAAREGRVLMFLDTKHAVDRFTRHLRGSGIRAAALHSGKSQPQRTHTLEQFQQGEVTVLVATNVAARGIHVDALDLVVNVDPPADAKDYLHRGGRTARAGESGRVVTLVTAGQRKDVSRLMTEAGVRPTVTAVRPGDAELARITGARQPSGVPLPGSTAPAADPGAAAGAATTLGFRGRGSSPGGRAKESRKSAEARKLAEARRAAKVRRGR
ncbi:DEAD/DEAH box helicase [Streptomyces antimicrobicus]|uniref:DEAD/DEAH box helicase n=1 Tax=Streptomyces antimicrobicus TaxID=2883108 RepID=A0ABS8B7Z5_9ACTN|nr:DEAD/DEAH box helicase [Streptomyces antimicrobicus]MCB5180691.1 DEAD/DEAH box helicase [Streptomyces antimicrobicus]